MLGVAMYTTIKTLKELGRNKSEIARITGHDWKTVSKVIKGNAETLSKHIKRQRFDTIIAGELIEHLEYPKHFIKEAYKALNKNGRLIITTPNRDAWINSLNLFLGKHYFEHQGHISVQTIEGMKKMLRENNFKIEKINFLSYDYDSLGRNDGYIHLVWLRKLINNMIPDRLKECMMIVARKI